MRRILRAKSSRRIRSLVLTVTAAVAVGALVAWIVFQATGGASSQEPHPNVPDFSQRPTFVPGTLSTPLPPDQQSLEPPPGALPSPSTAAKDTAIANTRNVPEGWTVYDNPKFQYTFALPPDWQTDLKPEGGVFSISNPAAVESNSTGTVVPGVAGGGFVGELRIVTSYPVLDHLSSPNTLFADYEGAIWEGVTDVDKEYGVANTVQFAFARGDVIFHGFINFLEEGYSDSRVIVAYEIFHTITPY